VRERERAMVGSQEGEGEGRASVLCSGRRRENKRRERKRWGFGLASRPKHFKLQHKYHSSRLPFCSDHGLLVGIHFLPSPLGSFRAGLH
jgi:hypothetical protein